MDQQNFSFDGYAANSSKKASKVVIPSLLVSFMQAVKKAGRRVAYGGWHTLCLHVGITGASCLNVTTASCRHLDLLPQEVQPHICRKGGSYDGKALGKWGHLVAMPALNAMPIIADDQVVNAFEAFKAHLEKAAS